MAGGNGEMEKKRDCNDSWKQKKRRYMKDIWEFEYRRLPDIKFKFWLAIPNLSW